MAREEQRDTACTNWICSQENGTVIKAREVWKAAVEWADSHPAWVSVEERLPEERKVVWVRKHFKRKYVGEFDLYDSAAFCNGEFQCDASGNVTHWMEITPPVKKGGEQ